MGNATDPPFGPNLVSTPIRVGRPMTLHVSGGTGDRIHDLAQTNGVDDAEVIKIGMALMEVYTKAKKSGRRLAVVDAEGKVVEDIEGP